MSVPCTLLLWALPTLPMLAGALLVLAGVARPALDRRAAPFALVIAVAVVVLAALVALERPTVRAPLLAGVDATLAVDGLSAILVVTVAVVALVVLAFAAVDLRDGRARFFGLMLAFVGAMLATVTASDLLVLLASWELMGAMSYALIGFWWRDPERGDAAVTAFLVTRGADLGQYLAAGAALAGAGSLAFAALPGASPGWRDVITAGIVVSALGKSAQLPFAFWISRAMVAAGGYLLLRMRPLLESTTWAGPAVAWAGALTALALGAVAVAQTDLKQLLAASTSAQIGFVVLAAGVGATAAGTAQLVAHAAVKSALFLAAGAWLSTRGTKALRSLRGVAREHRVLGAAAAVGFLTLAGVPPLSLWLTKDSVLAVAREQSVPLYLVGLAASVVSAAYAGRALAVVYGRSGPVDARDVEEEPTGGVGWVGAAAVAVLAAAGGLAGVQALPVVERGYAASLGGVAIVPSLGELGVSAVLAVAVLAATLALRGVIPAPGAPGWAPLRDWLGLERVSTAVVVRPTLVLARVCARWDATVLDRGVDAAVLAARRVAGRVAVADVRGVDGAVAAVTRGTRRLGRLARRPQTGQLHQYYAQAAVGLVVLLFVVLIGR